MEAKYKIEVTGNVLDLLVKHAKQYIKSSEYVMEYRSGDYTDKELEKIWKDCDDLQNFIDEMEDIPF